jgi:hypothetical protein
MKAAEKAALASLEKMRSGHPDKSSLIKTMDVAQRSFDDAFEAQRCAEVDRAKLERAAEKLDTFLNIGIDEVETEGMEDELPPIEDVVKKLLSERGPLTKEEIADALSGDFSRNASNDAITALRKQGAIVGASIVFKAPVWSLVEVGIKPEDIPGYTEETKAIASVAELYARGFKRSDIAEKMGITVDEVGRLKARSEGVAIVWYR